MDKSHIKCFCGNVKLLEVTIGTNGKLAGGKETGAAQLGLYQLDRV